MSLVTSPDSIVFGPDRPSEPGDSYYNAYSTLEETRRRDEFQRIYLNEIVPTLETPMGNHGYFREPVYPTVRSLPEDYLQVC